MARRRLTLAVLGGVTVLLLVTAGVMLTGAFGLVGHEGTGAPATPTTGTDATTRGPPFSLTTRTVEPCGTLCRSVTSTVTNERDTTARNVTVRTRLYAGNDTDDEVHWRGVEQVGTLEAGENYTVTRRVELALDSALAIREAGGWVTLRTTIASDDETVTVTDRREVD